MAATDDQLCRELIQAFPADFVRLAIPKITGRIELEALDFRQEEYFTDSPRGGRLRRPDLTARVPALAEDAGQVILHAEIEGRYRADQVARFFDYNRLLSMRHGLPVDPGGGRGPARRLPARDRYPQRNVLYQA